MARAKRHYLPGYAWHITHRCHEREFLLKFGRDRGRWLRWLFEARKRYDLCILNYVATSNHIHLLVFEIQQPRQRYALINHRCLMELLQISSMDLLQTSHRNWVEESLRVERNSRDSKWTESIAVGSKGFVAMVKKQLGTRAKGRRIAASVDECQVRETQSPYSTISGAENSLLSSNNLHSWRVYLVTPFGAVRRRTFGHPVRSFGGARRSSFLRSRRSRVRMFARCRV